MKIQTKQQLIGLYGPMVEERKTETGEKMQVPITIAVIAVNAITAPSDENRQLQGEEKMNRFLLAEKILRQEEVEITITEAAMIKKEVAKYFPIDIAGPFWKQLEAMAG